MSPRGPGMFRHRHGEKAESEFVARVSYAVARSAESRGLGPDEVRALSAIAAGARMWTVAAELARAGLDDSTLAGLASGGWVEDFHLASGPAATFTCWGAEALGLEPKEHWEFLAIEVEQEDSSGERTRSTVLTPVEVPRWDTIPLPPEPGAPRPRRKPLKLPDLYRKTRLPEEVLYGMIAKVAPAAADEAIAREELLMAEVRTEDDHLAVDEATGLVRLEPVVLLGTTIPRAKVRQRRGKARRKKAAAKARARAKGEPMSVPA